VAAGVDLATSFAGQNVGVTQVSERIWLVTFMRYDLGYFDDETCRLEPIDLEGGSSGWIRTSNPPVNRRKKRR